MALRLLGLVAVSPGLGGTLSPGLPLSLGLAVTVEEEALLLLSSLLVSSELSESELLLLPAALLWRLLSWLVRERFLYFFRGRPWSLGAAGEGRGEVRRK